MFCLLVKFLYLNFNSVLSQFAFHLSPTYELNHLQSIHHIQQNGFIGPKSSPSDSLTRRINKSGSKIISSMGNLSELHKVKPLQRLMTASSVVDPMNDPPCLSLSPNLLGNDENSNGMTDKNMTTVTTEATGDMLIKYHLFSWEL
ncbi:unnamed protein product [Trichobilharzia regenti]|nr:unnamed protein product [Trichobilharzia regenti]